jgi:uncharacterized protein YyaL (SSP411 family)
MRWLGWDPESLARGRREDKPILLAMGAAWCEMTRRMDAETYADPEVAALIEREYVPIRVDVDRFPEVFERYTMGASPSVVFLTDDGEVIAGATFLPAREMRQVLTYLAGAYRTRRDGIRREIREREERIHKARRMQEYPPAESVGPSVFQNTVRGIVATFDGTYGGFGQAPKFPMAASLRVLLQAFAETGGTDFAGMLVRTLDAMAQGALFDAVEGGFFHCSINERWTQPYQAKLLTDQAEMIRVFAAAARLFGKPEYRRCVERTVEYVEGTLRGADAAGYAASQASDPEYYVAGPRDPRRVPPIDRTVFLDANAQAAAALFEAAAALDRPDWGDQAARVVAALRARVDRPVHYWDNGRAERPDLSRDALWLARALIDRHEWTGAEEDLEAAARLLDGCYARFWDEEEGGLRDHAAAEPFGALRRAHKNIAENAVAAQVDLRLASLRDQPACRERAGRTLLSFPNFLQDYGHYTAEFALAADWYARPVVQVRLAGADPPLRRAALGCAVPRKVVRSVAPDAAQPAGTAVVLRPGEAPVKVERPERLVEALKG